MSTINHIRTSALGAKAASTLGARGYKWLYAGGNFRRMGLVYGGDRECRRVARWNGTQWHPLAGGVGGLYKEEGGNTGNQVAALAVTSENRTPDDDRLHAGGAFGYAEGEPPLYTPNAQRWKGAWTEYEFPADDDITAASSWNRPEYQWIDGDWQLVLHPGVVFGTAAGFYYHFATGGGRHDLPTIGTDPKYVQNTHQLFTGAGGLIVVGDAFAGYPKLHRYRAAQPWLPPEDLERYEGWDIICNGGPPAQAGNVYAVAMHPDAAGTTRFWAGGGFYFNPGSPEFTYRHLAIWSGDSLTDPLGEWRAFLYDDDWENPAWERACPNGNVQSMLSVSDSHVAIGRRLYLGGLFTSDVAGTVTMRRIVSLKWLSPGSPYYAWDEPGGGIEQDEMQFPIVPQIHSLTTWNRNVIIAGSFRPDWTQGSMGGARGIAVWSPQLREWVGLPGTVFDVDDDFDSNRHVVRAVTSKGA